MEQSLALQNISDVNSNITNNDSNNPTETISGTILAKKRCPKGTRRVNKSDGSFDCITLKPNQKKQNDIRRVDMTKEPMTEELENLKRCPKGFRKVFENEEKTKWKCIKATKEQENINEINKKKYNNEIPETIKFITTKPKKPLQDILLKNLTKPNQDIEDSESNSDSDSDSDSDCLSKIEAFA